MELVPENHRRTTLAQQLAAAVASASEISSSSPSPNLRDLLKVSQEDLHQHRQHSAGRRISLGTFLACEKRELSRGRETRPAVTRTLLDVIRDEGDSAAADGGEAAPAAAQPEAPPSAAAPVEQPQQIRVSLMALLEQADKHGGGAALLEVGEEEEREDGGGGGRTGTKCCVCMVREKGAAFIPCGHTFCRLCSRELWISRGNCPLCNGLILEILDIF